MGSAYKSGEHRGASEFLKKRHPRGRRNSISQSENIHLAETLDPAAIVPTFTSKQMEDLRQEKRGSISIKKLINLMHKSQERTWDPSRGEGRKQIRTGRNFSVPDSEHPGESFIVRIHTNDNTIEDRKLNAATKAVVRIQRTADNKYLMGGRTHAQNQGDNAWSGRRATDADINAAHIPTSK